MDTSRNVAMLVSQRGETPSLPGLCMQVVLHKATSGQGFLRVLRIWPVSAPASFIHSFINHSTIFPGCNVPGAVPRCTDSVRICYVPISDRKARSVRHSRLHTAALYKHYYNRAIYQEDKTPMFIFSYKLCRRGLTRRLKHFCARDRAGDCQDQPFSAVISVQPRPQKVLGSVP